MVFGAARFLLPDFLQGSSSTDVLENVPSFAATWFDLILYFVIVVTISVLLIKGKSTRIADFASNAKLLGYSFAWFWSLFALVLAFGPDNDVAQTFFNVAIFAFFVYLYAFAMMTANGISVRRGAIYGICVLLIVSSAFTLGQILLALSTR
jgi:hypothetical protein